MPRTLEEIATRGRAHNEGKSLIVMETVMNGTEKRAGYYRGYLTDDRSLIPLTIVLGIIVALWLLVYLIGSVGAPYKPQMGLLGPHASPTVALQHPPEAAPRH
jgi:hypothetical protein